MSRQYALRRLLDAVVIPAVQDPDDAQVKSSAMELAAAGAGELVLVMLPGQGMAEWADSVAKLRSQGNGRMLIGLSRAGPGLAGDGPTGVTAGAVPDFVIDSTFSESRARALQGRGVLYIPTVTGPDELRRAAEIGVDLAAYAPSESATVPDPGGLVGWLGHLPARQPGQQLGDLLARQCASVYTFSICPGDVTAADAAPAALVHEILAVRAAARAASGQPLFGNVEHTGIYTGGRATVEQIASWYESVFGLPVTRGKTTFVGSGIDGRVEILPSEAPGQCHLAIRVLDFEAAVADLGRRGIALERFNVSAAAKLAYLADRDPAGNQVHIMWRAG